ncbi:hypothetical protein Q7P37_004417 [Cladosporium fusiforme]
MASLFPRQANDTQTPSEEYLSESNVASILGITGSFTFAALVVVCLRLYVRIRMLRFVGPDDWTMVAASLMALGTFVCLCGESKYGMGRHREWQKPWMFKPFLQWLFAHNLLVMWGIVLVKISIAFFLMRIMLQKAWKIFLWASVVFLACFALACTGTLVFACTPVAASWDFTIRSDPNTRCFSYRTFGNIGLFNSIINIITDVVFVVIPIPIVLRLQVNQATKVSLILVLSLGFVACAAGIVKARLQATAFETPDQGFQNLFHLWFVLELCLGILAASLPTLKPLFTAVLEGTRSRLGTIRRSRGTDEAYGGPNPRSRSRPQADAYSFPAPTDPIELRRHKKGSSTTGLTTTDAASVADSSDVDFGKLPYNVHVTGGPRAEDTEPWDSITAARYGSEERLHQPATAIYKTVELTHERYFLRQVTHPCAIFGLDIGDLPENARLLQFQDFLPGKTIQQSLVRPRGISSWDVVCAHEAVAERVGSNLLVRAWHLMFISSNKSMLVS